MPPEDTWQKAKLQRQRPPQGFKSPKQSQQANCQETAATGDPAATDATGDSAARDYTRDAGDHATSDVETTIMRLDISRQIHRRSFPEPKPSASRPNLSIS